MASIPSLTVVERQRVHTLPGPLKLFVVLALDDSGSAIKGGIIEHFPDDFYDVEDGKWLVAAPLVTAKQVSDKIGITRDQDVGEVTGLVFRVGGYFGRGSRDMGEWVSAKSVKSSA